jgi:hypothetical protein
MSFYNDETMPFLLRSLNILLSWHVSCGTPYLNDENRKPRIVNIHRRVIEPLSHWASPLLSRLASWLIRRRGGSMGVHLTPIQQSLVRIPSPAYGKHWLFLRGLSHQTDCSVGLSSEVQPWYKKYISPKNTVEKIILRSTRFKSPKFLTHL